MICIFKIVTDIFNNYIVRVAGVSWMVAQSLKIMIYYFINKKFSVERLLGAGGMPSSHSALVCATAVATYKKCGADSAIFALSLVLAGIVMYDAMGVRRAAGEQAKVINKVIINPLKKDSDNIDEKSFENIAIKTLKEFLGHTPSEVLGGAILGGLIAVLM